MFETLLSDGYKAILAADNNVCTKAVENIIEATYLSELVLNRGLVAATIHNGFTAIKETDESYHGEKVALVLLFN